MFKCAADAPDSPAPEADIVCIMSAASVMPRPAPPCSSGIAIPSQPDSASTRWKSSGNPPSRSLRSQYSASNGVHRRSIASRICSLSGVNGKSIIDIRSCWTSMRWLLAQLAAFLGQKVVDENLLAVRQVILEGVLVAERPVLQRPLVREHDVLVRHDVEA